MPHTLVSASNKLEEVCYCSASASSTLSNRRTALSVRDYIMIISLNKPAILWPLLDHHHMSMCISFCSVPVDQDIIQLNFTTRVNNSLVLHRLLGLGGDFLLLGITEEGLLEFV